MKEFLDSDRVNFLVWRYLLEANYRETAAKLQKEWHIHEPHRHFDFAPHVKSHALVSVLNHGLLYHSLERERARKQLPQSAAAGPVRAASEAALGSGVFGPLKEQPPPRKFDEDDEDEDAEHDEEEVARDEKDVLSRKRHTDSRPQLGNGDMNGVAAKKPRLSNGYENRADSATTPMEIDQGGGPGENNNAYPSPLEGEQVPTPIPRTEGPEQGTQVDKVQELTPRTTFLRLTNDDGPEATSPTSSINEGTENAPILLHCEWNPTDPSMLAAAGTDALARVWTISRATTITSGAPNDGGQLTNHVGSIVTRPGRNLIQPAAPSTSVTAMAWNADGQALAIAADDGAQGRLSVYSAEGDFGVGFPIAEPPVLKVRWNPSSTAILTVSPCDDARGMLVSVYQLASEKSLRYRQPTHEFESVVAFDAVWTGDSEFLLCGGDTLIALRCSDSGINVARKYETRPDDNFTQILFDWRSKLAATSSDKGVLDLWDDAGERRSIMAHSGSITALQWQPLQSSPAENERLIASAGDDCAILIWNARIPEKQAKCCVTMEHPIVAIAFTPDGAFIAGATYNQVLIWKVGDHVTPRASWSRTPHPGWLSSPRANSEDQFEDSYSLCWDANGQKLAYGANSRLAVIDFR